VGYDIISYVLTVIISIAVGYFGLRMKYRQLQKVFKESGELLLTISDAMDDEQITKEEIKQIVKEADDVIVSVKQLINR